LSPTEQVTASELLSRVRNSKKLEQIEEVLGVPDYEYGPTGLRAGNHDGEPPLYRVGAPGQFKRQLTYVREGFRLTIAENQSGELDFFTFPQ
jgi:hypothetical protein